MPIGAFMIVMLCEGSAYPSSCMEVLADDPSAPDGEYMLLLGFRLRSIYCYGMATGKRFQRQMESVFNDSSEADPDSF